MPAARACGGGGGAEGEAGARAGLPDAAAEGVPPAGVSADQGGADPDDVAAWQQRVQRFKLGIDVPPDAAVLLADVRRDRVLAVGAPPPLFPAPPARSELSVPAEVVAVQPPPPPPPHRPHRGRGGGRRRGGGLRVPP